MKKRILIYGAGAYANTIIYSFNTEECEVIGLVDSDAKKWGHSMYGLKVFAPTEIEAFEYDLIVIASKSYEDEIRNCLVYKFNVPESKIERFQPTANGVGLNDSRIVILYKCMELMKQRNISGDMAEVGVYRGDFSKHFNSFFPSKKLYLFDTFEGFDTTRDEVAQEIDKTLFKDTSIDYVLSQMKKPESCVIKKGYFPDTAVDVQGDFCLVSLDCDLYNPILAGLEFFYPRLMKGGYIFVHDFGPDRYPGVKKAVLEYCEKTGMSFLPINDVSSSVIIVK